MMHLIRRFPIIPALVLAIIAPAPAQNNLPVDVTLQEHRSADGRYTYHTVPGDPLGVRIYRLKNGLTIMISVNKAEPRIQTLIATRAGSKNDPANHTGLAHYLEHMLFKGTDRVGTTDWATESTYITRIEGLYERYNQTRDEAERRAIYRMIDSVSGIAARYAIANEYDKLLSVIGAEGTNAFTSTEQTVYVNDIPSNQLGTWLRIEAERFRAPVFRLFHTELEAVYEEKNISLDNDDSKVFEALMGGLFRNHAYGTQTTIGTIEHLKNPSLKEIRKYYETYYVPNNMAIILAGDLDPDRAVAMIDEHLGGMRPSPSVPTYTFQPEPPRSTPELITVQGPDAELVRIGFRMPGAGDRDALLLELADLLLAYKGSGLIDINLNQGQRVIDAGSSPWIMKDYSVHYFGAKPREGQSMDEVRDLILEQVEKIKRGEFDETTLQAVIRNLEVDQIRQYENNSGRAYAMLDAFTLQRPWEEYSRKIKTMAGFTKQDVVDFARRRYGRDYVVVYKRTGENGAVVKVDKPPISPVPINREAVSPFVTAILATPTPPVQPLFLDYGRDIHHSQLKTGAELLYLPNSENNLFSLYYVFDIGKLNDLRLPISVKYLKLLGTKTMTAEQVSRAFFNLGAQFDVSVSDDQVYVSLTGLRENFLPALKLFEDVLANAVPDQKALDAMVAQELKLRNDAKLDKNSILWGGLYNYARYGRNNPFTYRISEKELKELKGADLVSRIRALCDYRHTVLYYGPTPVSEVVETLDANHRMPVRPMDYPSAKEFPHPASEKVVYFVHYDGMVQAELLWLNRQGPYDATVVPHASIFNQYYGGDMSSVVFQEIRESKALAYSTFAAYDMPDRKSDPFYVLAYIGTQADKVADAIPAMNTILRNMPVNEGSFAQTIEALRNRLQTERIVRTSILFNYLKARKMGVDHDLRIDTYDALNTTTIDDLKRFHAARFGSGDYTLALLGDRAKVDLKELAKYGRVVELSVEDVFGY